MRLFSKESLIEMLKDIRNRGWIENARHKNQGGVGNTLEDLLGIKENNLPIPNAAEWELKAQRINNKGIPQSYITLSHLEPSPRAIKFVPNIFLPKYGWLHKDAGSKYPETTMSFRQTINGLKRTNRGFGIKIDYIEQKIVVSFDYTSVNTKKHSEWLKSVEQRVGLSELDPQPYWGFNDLFHHIGTKMLNCFYVQAEVKKNGELEYYYYKNIFMFQTLSQDALIKAFADGKVFIDFDASSHHNHGTKMRLKRGAIFDIYEKVTVID